MPRIDLGPDYRSFSDVAHQIAAEREAEVQAQLQRDRLNADVEQARLAAQQRAQQGQVDQEQFDRQMALKEFQAEAERNLRQMEQDRLKQAQETAFNANNFKRAVETGVMLDESGTKYIPVTEEDHPELWKARQEYTTDKRAKEERLRETDRENQARFLAAQQLQYLKAGFKLEQVEDPTSGRFRLVSRPLGEQDPEWNWYQEQQRLAEEKILTPEERIRIEEAKAGLKQPAEEAKQRKELEARYDRLDRAVSSEESKLNKLQSEFDRAAIPRPDSEREAELRKAVADARAEGGKSPSKKEAQAISTAEAMLRGHIEEKARYEDWQKRLDTQRNRILEAERKRDTVGARLDEDGEEPSGAPEGELLTAAQLEQINAELLGMSPQERADVKAKLVANGRWKLITDSMAALGGK